MKTIFSKLLIIFGLCLSIYPLLSQIYQNHLNQLSLLTYQNEINDYDKPRQEKMYEEAILYNQALFQKAHNELNYEDLLNIDGKMGFVEIAKIDVNLPIYHGTSDEVLNQGCGHIEMSSLPVGGNNTHCLLSGHSGMANQLLFTRLDELIIGDIFKIHVLGQILYYQVDDIKVILPDKTSDLEIIENEDYVSLITCTPFGINSHRLVVRGKRIEMDENNKTENKKSHFSFVLCLQLLPLLVLVLMILIRSFKEGGLR